MLINNKQIFFYDDLSSVTVVIEKQFGIVSFQMKYKFIRLNILLSLQQMKSNYASYITDQVTELIAIT